MANEQQKPQHAQKETKEKPSDTAPNRRVSRAKSYWLGHEPANESDQRGREQGARRREPVTHDDAHAHATPPTSATPVLRFDPLRVDPRPTERSAVSGPAMRAGGAANPAIGAM